MLYFASKTFHRLQPHCAATALAFFVGLISIAPQLIFSLSPEYKGIQMFGTDTEDYYVARINEIYDGHFGLGNVFLPDKNKPYMAPPLGEIVMAGIGKALFLDAAGVTVFAKFLFPFILFLVLYFFIYSVFSSRSIALVSASLVLLGDNLLSSYGDIIGLLTFTTTSQDFLSYSRPVNPQISSLLFFASLFLLWEVLKSHERRNGWVWVFLGVLSGLSIYVSIYVWSFLLVALFISFFSTTAAYRKFARFKFTSKFTRFDLVRWLIVLSAHLITIIPFGLNSISARMYPEYADTAARLGLAASRTPTWGVWLAFITLAILLWPKQYDHARLFFGVLALSSWVVVNQQIITGMILQPGHYHWYIIKPIAGVLLAAVFVFFVERFFKKPLVATLLVSLAVATFVYNAGLIQFSSYRAQLAEALEKQRYAPLIYYLRENYQIPQTIWSDKAISAILPIYTIHNTPNHNSVFAFLSSKEYLIGRLLFEYRLRGVPTEVFVPTVKREIEFVSGRVFGHRYSDFSTPVQEELVTGLEKQYKDSYPLQLKTFFNNFEIGLVVQDRRYERDIVYDSYPILAKLSDIGDDFTIYKLK